MLKAPINPFTVLSIILIVGMMPFAVALQKTGGVALAVKGLMDIGGGYGPHMMLGCLFVLSAVIGLFISNTATAVLMAPDCAGCCQNDGCVALSICDGRGDGQHPPPL